MAQIPWTSRFVQWLFPDVKERLSGGNVVLTVFPNIFEALLRGYDPGELRPRIDEEVPRKVVDELLKVPYFRQGYEEDGLKPEQWIDYPPVVATAKEFAKATDDMEEWAGEMMV